MSMFGIMRIEKRRRGAVYGLQIEANREKDDYNHGRDFDRSDIDWGKTDKNIHLVRTENWNKEITRQIHKAGLKERKNSTVMLDGLYTASSDWFEQHTMEEAIDYLRDCLAYHVQEYCMGDRSRVINAVIHLDEATPHLQVASVPIYQDHKGMHLSAKVLCGSRSDFRIHQDRFFSQVSKKYGLERGEVKDWPEVKAHTTKREWQMATQQEKIEKSQTEIDGLDAQIDDKKHLKAVLEYEYKRSVDALNRETLELQGGLAELNEQIAQAASEKAQILSEQKDAERQKEALERELEGLQGHIIERQAKLDILDDQIAEGESILDSLSNKNVFSNILYWVCKWLHNRGFLSDWRGAQVSLLDDSELRQHMDNEIAGEKQKIQEHKRRMGR